MQLRTDAFHDSSLTLTIAVAVPGFLRCYSMVSRAETNEKNVRHAVQRHHETSPR